MEGLRQYRIRKARGYEGIIFVFIFFLPLGLIATRMGLINMINTLFNNAFQLLVNTVFYIMAISVLMGALSGLLNEFGVVAIANKLLSPIINPIFGLPGAAIVSIMTCYMSDNPAILTLCSDHKFKGLFQKYQIPALTNMGTAFGMGMVVSIYMISLPNPHNYNYILAVIIGNIGAFIGSIISTRLMIRKTKKLYGYTSSNINTKDVDYLMNREVRPGSLGERFVNAMLDGGKSGVNAGLSIIPGVLIICSFVLVLTNGPAETGGYTGSAYEGVAALPWLGEKLSFILTPMFGFNSSSFISVPITAMGSAGAAISLVPSLINTFNVTANDLAVFTAMCMCWSGYFSTHVAMMDGLGARELTGSAIVSHTIGGIGAGVAASMLCRILVLFNVLN